MYPLVRDLEESSQVAPLAMVRVSPAGAIVTVDSALEMRVQLPDGRDWSCSLMPEEVKARTTSFPREVCFDEQGELAFAAVGPRVSCIDLWGERVCWQSEPRTYFGFLFASPSWVDTTPSGDLLITDDLGGWEMRAFDGVVLSRRRVSECPRRFFVVGDRVVGLNSVYVDVRELENGRRLHRFRHDPPPQALAVSNDGSRVAVRLPHEVAWFALDAPDKRQSIRAPHDLPMLKWLPDDSGFAVARDRGVAFVDFEGSETRYIESASRVLDVAFGQGEILMACDDGDLRSGSL